MLQSRTNGTRPLCNSQFPQGTSLYRCSATLPLTPLRTCSSDTYSMCGDCQGERNQLPGGAARYRDASGILRFGDSKKFSHRKAQRLQMRSTHLMNDTLMKTRAKMTQLSLRTPMRDTSPLMPLRLPKPASKKTDDKQRWKKCEKTRRTKARQSVRVRQAAPTAKRPPRVSPEDVA